MWPKSFQEPLPPEELDSVDGVYAYMGGRVIPLREAKVSVMTHAFLYGTAIFESLRGYFNPDDGEVFVFRLSDHSERMRRNGTILKMASPPAEEISRIVIDVIRACGYREDCYIRTVLYKSGLQFGLRLSDMHDLTVLALPQGRFTKAARPISVCVSSWRRMEDNAVPGRAKICGGYVNSALAKAEALDNGFEDAIFVGESGHVVEGTGMNLFLVRGGRLITPSSSENIVEGITRDTILEMARNELGIEAELRPVNRSELYTADELFFSGTALEVTLVESVDRRVVGNGSAYPIAEKLKTLYFDAVRGKKKEYEKWLTPVYGQG
ncbi:MAG TPA: branched-chain amino acid transaminase [Pyrinomonadaceae bacterium]|nr:branched-chain amino acid transaminase [Pyrinomonadaceae bacterium]